MTDYLNDDENVKMMRDTAQRVGLTDLLACTQRELVGTLAALDRSRARLTRALELLGVADDDGGAR
ncbi:MAG TPA: hypothetical protein VMM93_05660 [Vicinamibacterales bacterium]|nr:hypothetical protein [Vicinamibacterales bacterium]